MAACFSDSQSERRPPAFIFHQPPVPTEDRRARKNALELTEEGEKKEKKKKEKKKRGKKRERKKKGGKNEKGKRKKQKSGAVFIETDVQPRKNQK